MSDVHLFLTIGGTAVDGPSLVSDREGSIECLEYDDGITIGGADRQTRSAAAPDPIGFVKQIDRTSPLLLQALDRGSPVDAQFRFYRMNHDIGHYEHYFTVEATKAALVSIARLWPTMMDGEHPAPLVTERVELVYPTLTVRHEATSTEYRYQLSD